VEGSRSDVIERDGKFYAWDGNAFVDMNSVPQNFTNAVTMTDAVIMMTALPTSDPSVAGQLWADSGVVTISAGA